MATNFPDTDLLDASRFDICFYGPGAGEDEAMALAGHTIPHDAQTVVLRSDSKPLEFPLAMRCTPATRYGCAVTACAEFTNALGERELAIAYVTETDPDVPRLLRAREAIWVPAAATVPFNRAQKGFARLRRRLAALAPRRPTAAW